MWILNYFLLFLFTIYSIFTLLPNWTWTLSIVKMNQQKRVLNFTCNKWLFWNDSDIFWHLPALLEWNRRNAKSGWVLICPQQQPHMVCVFVCLCVSGSFHGLKPDTHTLLQTASRLWTHTHTQTLALIVGWLTRGGRGGTTSEEEEGGSSRTR